MCGEPEKGWQNTVLFSAANAINSNISTVETQKSVVVPLSFKLGSGVLMPQTKNKKKETNKSKGEKTRTAGKKQE